MKKKGKGIGPALIGLATSLAGGLINSKKDRDKESPAAAGVLRDVGITAAGVAGGSMALTANGVIDCTLYGMEPEFCNLAHAFLLIAGFVMYWFGIGKSKKPEITEEKPKKK